MLDINEERFYVSGVQSLTTNESYNGTEVSVHGPSNGSMKLKPTAIKRMQKTECYIHTVIIFN